MNGTMAIGISQTVAFRAVTCRGKVRGKVRAKVDADGTVRVYDSVAGYYSVHTGLSAQEVRALAALAAEYRTTGREPAAPAWGGLLPEDCE